ncbi:hypothetical protein SO802_012253 [Lithocarpus litseifolius]|uniref:Aminotransferase-like plant mobile domain-containing protein n=1 Tax=Lithocarpus litseifolius TaxID=425828 RepID=A0AAW2D2V0_9ROSI
MNLGISIRGDILPTETMTRKEVSQTLGMHRVKKSKRKIFVGVGDNLKVMLDLLFASIPWKKHLNDYVLRSFFLYFVGSCFLSGEKSTIRARLVRALVDLSRIETYDRGGLFFRYHLHSMRQFACRETSSFCSFRQFTIYWAYEYCCSMRLEHAALDENAFPQARRWDIDFLKSTNAVSLLECCSKVDGLRETDLIFKPYPHLLLN